MSKLKRNPNNATRPNIVLIVLDTARAQSFSCHGYGRQTTPNIDRIAREGMLFENAVSPSPWTLPAHASLFTGMYPSAHGCHEKHKFLSPDLDTLPRMLQRCGYRTIGISSNTWISGSFGFDRGFDRFFNAWQLVQSETDIADPSAKGIEKYRRAADLLLRGNALVNASNAVYGKFFWRRYDYGARRINRMLKRLIGREAACGRPFFLFVNYLEPHLLYKAPEPFLGKFLPAGSSKREALSVNQDAWSYMGGLVPMGARDRELLTALYDEELAYLDHRIGQLYGFLKEAGTLDNTLLVLTSDHGENIGDHGLMDHQYCLYDSLLKVPLILRYPEACAPGSRCGRVVQTTDVLPTVLEIVAGQSESPIQGKSLLQEDGERFAFSEYHGPQPTVEVMREHYPRGDFSRYDRSLFSIRSSEWKYIGASNGVDELYNVVEDPEETQNVIERFPEVSGNLRGKLDTWKEGFAEGGEDSDDAHISAEIKEQLEALGYFT